MRATRHPETAHPSVTTVYVVTYDVSDDKVRACIAATLEGVGERVQESVFECLLDVTSFAALRSELAKLLASDATASVRLYPICAQCRTAATGLGTLRPTRFTSACVVV